MLSTTLAGLRSHGRRLVSAGLAILLGTAFIATTLIVGATVKGSVEQAVAADIGQRAVVVTSVEATIDAGTVDALAAVEGITGVTVQREASLMLPNDGYALARSVPSGGSAVEVTSGRMPRAPGEVALASTVAAAQELSVGDTLTVTTHEYDAPGDAEEPDTLSVVGVVDTTNNALLPMAPTVFAADPDLAAWDPEYGIRELHADAAPGYSDEQLRDTVTATLDDGLVVRTGPEQATHTVAMMTGGTDILTTMLLGFGAVALLVSAIVIANTFTIVLAQRTRDMALLRTVGATRAQVFRSVLLEAAVLAAVASGAGLLGGLGLATAISGWAESADLGIPMGHLTVTGVSMVLPFVLGLVVTLAAAMVPARRATRVAPLAALRPVAEVRARSRAGVLRLVLAALALAAGVVLLVLGASAQQLLVGVGGGMLSFLGVLLASTVLVPGAVRTLGAIPSRLAGVPGQLAVDNAVRNPSRAAATSAALLVGVTLITMMSVGAATAQRAAGEEIAQQYPIDAGLRAQEEVPAGVARAAADVPGVERGMPLVGATLQVQADGVQSSQQVLGVDPQQAGDVLRSPEMVADLAEGVLLVELTQAQGLGVSEGDQVAVSAGERSLPMTVRLSESGPAVAMTPADLQQLVPDAPTTALWLRLDDGADLGAVMEGLAGTTAGADGVTVVGAAPQRVQLEQVLDVMLLVVTGLLGVAVLIALIGIGNTLSLSVLERTRESALLRALGLTRAQLRGMLAVEAVLLAGVSAGLGVLLGAFYGWMGAQTVLPSGTAVSLVMPWGRVALVVVVALAAGLLASVLPARRAARVAPAAALADG